MSARVAVAWLASCGLLACLAPPASTAKSAAAPAPSVGRKLAKARHCTWPNSAKAAVSLTYDDGLMSQVRFAAPVLEQYGLKATFFLSGGNMAEFSALGRAGHELASHTIKHPCNAELAAMTLADMAAELDASRAAVAQLGQAGKLSFAYPCGQVQLAQRQSYVPLVEQRFRAARGVAGVVARPESVDMYNVPAFFPPISSDGSDALAFIERALGSGGWAVIGVHGVSEAGEYLQWSQPAHDKVVAYLGEHKSEIWTAPFGTVADFVASCP
jgi:peptidoglycan/xylan/chitin deacetylase (PgdA/CDA1 family)